jgi:hypothetical protein
MNRKRLFGRAAPLGLLALLALSGSVGAQTFVYNNNDLMLGFRKTGVYQENNEVVVNIGQASNYVSAANGSVINITNFSLAQLMPGSYSSLDHLSWSVVGWYTGTTYPGYPTYTLWVTVPRSSFTVQTASAARLDRASQQTIRAQIASIFANASFISTDLTASNAYNTVSLVREAIATYPTHILTVFMGGKIDNTLGTLQDTWPEGNLETATPSGFSGSMRSDLYEVRPTNDQSGNPIVDPHMGTNGQAYYVGYFQLNSDGTMTFTREVRAPVVSFSRSGNTSTITFPTVSGVIYSLYYTNTAGLATPLYSWPNSPSLIIGDSTTQSFSDVTSDSSRIYRVGTQ